MKEMIRVQKLFREADSVITFEVIEDGTLLISKEAVDSIFILTERGLKVMPEEISIAAVGLLFQKKMLYRIAGTKRYLEIDIKEG